MSIFKVVLHCISCSREAEVLLEGTYIAVRRTSAKCDHCRGSVQVFQLEDVTKEVERIRKETAALKEAVWDGPRRGRPPGHNRRTEVEISPS